MLRRENDKRERRAQKQKFSCTDSSFETSVTRDLGRVCGETNKQNPFHHFETQMLNTWKFNTFTLFIE